MIILCLGIAMWLVYGVYVHDVPVICANGVTLLLSSLILGLKIRYRTVETIGDFPVKGSCSLSAAPSIGSTVYRQHYMRQHCMKRRSFLSWVGGGHAGDIPTRRVSRLQF